MKAVLLFHSVIIAAMCAAVMSFCTSCTPEAESLEISFNYSRQSGPGSNQYAVWIEDADANVVKTLFVTSFSAKGRSWNGEPADRGYHYRPSCVHNWVKNVNADSLTDEQIDSFTGATPAEDGIQSFIWDFTDENGNIVPDGTYKAVIEADLHDWTIKTYTCTVVTGQKAGELEFDEDYSDPDEKYESMITDVKFELK